MPTFFQDLRYAVRMLWKSRGVSFAVIFALALGIGANTAIFSIVNSVLLRPLPYKDAAQVVTVWEKRIKENVLDNTASPADFLDWKREAKSFSAMSGMVVTTINYTGEDEPQRFWCGVVSPTFFDVLGVTMASGRTFAADEEQVGHHRVAVISNGLWKRSFGSDAKIVGREMILDGQTYSVVGVLPESFRFPLSDIDVWRPIALSPELSHIRGAHYMFVYARLRTGVTLEQAQAEMDTIATRIEKENPDINRGHGANIIPFRERIVGPVRDPLLILLAAVAFVLLIACANAANLLLARSAARQKEFAIRAALGAGRWRLARQMLTESVLLSLLGGVAGLLLALWGVDVLHVILPETVGVIGYNEFSVNTPVLLFALGVSLLTGIVFGLMPAVQVSRVDLHPVIQEAARVSPGSLRYRMRAALVVSEVALSLMLLVGAGLMIRSLWFLLDVPSGFDAENVTTLPLGIPQRSYPDDVRRAAFFEQLLQNVRATSGVEFAGAISQLPLSGMDSRTGVTIEGREPRPDEPTRMHHRIVAGDYFSALHVSLIDGRLFNEHDTPDTTPVLLVNQAAVRRFWPNGSPVGKRVRLGGTEVWREVVGVVGDVHHWGLDNAVNPEMYLPSLQSPSSFMSLVVRSRIGIAGITPALRNAVWAVDKNQPVPKIETLQSVVDRSISNRRFQMILLSTFAGVAVLLAGVGIYGVMSYSVSQRINEIGIRMALGAEARDVVRLVLGQGFRLVLIGLLAGVAGALLLSSWMQTLLFQVSPRDGSTFAIVSVFLAGVALLACWVPARRAARVDPMVALRYE